MSIVSFPVSHGISGLASPDVLGQSCVCMVPCPPGCSWSSALEPAHLSPPRPPEILIGLVFMFLECLTAVVLLKSIRRRTHVLEGRYSKLTPSRLSDHNPSVFVTGFTWNLCPNPSESTWENRKVKTGDLQSYVMPISSHVVKSHGDISIPFQWLRGDTGRKIQSTGATSKQSFLHLAAEERAREGPCLRKIWGSTAGLKIGVSKLARTEMRAAPHWWQRENQLLALAAERWISLRV